MANKLKFALVMAVVAAALAPVAQASPMTDEMVMIKDGSGKVLLKMSEAEVLALPAKTFKATTPWFPDTREFKGPLFRDILKKANIKSPAILEIEAYNKFKVDFPVKDAEQYGVILATHMNGKQLTLRDKGPLFLMYPMDDVPELKTGVYFNRSAWQIKTMTVR